ncbi:acyltransferase family protein [Aeromicrobium alkaliterrae]|uniref:Acyltransferase family protein n=1 Tax=Aeromicrobium alkaliterrae TaxID=302168 RepID=A0ABN2JEH0_9ACTN
MRTDIQALRALAVGLVVLNHLWPGRLGGGYVGVDVFFVISGFLITGHLMKEVEGTDRLGFLRFYARRARRLLPAATLVLVVSAVTAYLVLPFTAWERTAWETIASALYVENWYLAAKSVDYMALNDQATAAQHYWSLSVEEQFYLVWPALLVGVWALARRRSAVVTAIIVVGAVSFVLGQIAVSSGSPSAYFVTHGRVWEFAVGALVALLATRHGIRGRAAGVLAGVGFVAVVAAAFLFDDATAFPGVNALLPVLGTAAVIWAGTGRAHAWHDAITANPVVQWLGDISYSLYLWHWPLIVLVPPALGRGRDLVTSVSILALSLLLADLTKRFVEDRFRSRASWVRSNARSLTAAGSMMLVTAIVGTGLVAAYGHENAKYQPPQEATVASCLGPNALVDPEACGDDPFGPVSVPTPGSLSDYTFTPEECSTPTELFAQDDFRPTVECDFSGGDEAAPQVWLVGDSHAQQWQGLVLDLGRDRGWDVTLSYLGACPIADVPYVGFRTPAPDWEVTRCETWSEDVQQGVVDAQPDLVFTSTAARLEFLDDGTDRPQVDQLTDSFARIWGVWTEAGVPVMAIADPPLNGEVRDPGCVDLEGDDPRVCAVDRAVAQPPDPVALAAQRVPEVGLLDLTDYFCDPALCYGVVGGLDVYHDGDHLSLAFVRQFRDIVAAQLPETV